jgi:hypothetical protein
MTDYTEGSTLSFGLPYGFEVEVLESAFIPRNGRREFRYALRYFNRDYSWLGPRVLIREWAFKTLLDNADSFPHFDTIGEHYRFWFHAQDKDGQYWQLLHMVADIECMRLNADKGDYRDTVGKA